MFALDVDTGAILWTYRGNPDPRAGVPIGRSSRGVAMGEGKIFVGQNDAQLVALDQRTGEVVWSIEAERWQDGFSITSAPLYYDGMVITGFTGGEMASRGRVKAFDAKTASSLWTFYTVPGPGEFGHDTWPQDSDAWQFGGAPRLADAGRRSRARARLFLDRQSRPRPARRRAARRQPVQRLDRRRRRAHRQIPLALPAGASRHLGLRLAESRRAVRRAGTTARMRKGLVQVSKTGWAYILDRETGEPLIGIEERPVPQEPRQATAATQPYPIGDAIVPQSIDIPPEGASVLPNGAALVNDGKIFTPFWTDPITVKPGTMGGANWPPSSYDPETHLLYVCASDRISTFSVRENLPDARRPNQVYMGGALHAGARPTTAAFSRRSTCTTNKLAWRQQWREICYSGSVVTAGGLLFVGRNDGRLTALDKRTAKLLWEFMTDAGVNTTVTTFEHNGKQRVVVHAGGGVFANGKRGDGIWMFSLDGTMKSLPVAGRRRAAAAAASAAAGRRRRAGAPVDVEHGAQLYAEACVACHGEQATAATAAGRRSSAGLPPRRSSRSSQAGRNTMPAFGRAYSEADLRDVAAYIVEVLAK